MSLTLAHFSEIKTISKYHFQMDQKGSQCFFLGFEGGLVFEMVLEYSFCIELEEPHLLTPKSCNFKCFLPYGQFWIIWPFLQG